MLFKNRTCRVLVAESNVQPSLRGDASRMSSLAKGCPPGTVIVAGEQTAGTGRYGRHWHSEPESGLYLSIVIGGNLDPVITLALGLAVADAIQQTTNVTCDLRWPNDILISEKKAAGILTQLEGESIIAGIGINVNHTAFPPDLVATSLRLASNPLYSDNECDCTENEMGMRTTVYCIFLFWKKRIRTLLGLTINSCLLY